MNEYITEAIVVEKEIAGENDKRVLLYTKDMGLVVARAKSASKITSKLSSHLEPLSLTRVRLVKKNSLQITDALKIGSINKTKESVSLLQFIRTFFSYDEPDAELWLLFKEKFEGNKDIRIEPVLKILGFDPLIANCNSCSSIGPQYFSALGNFLCNMCSRNINHKENLIDVTASI
jgi:recombinational DNA repair protein (RecF pathway)